jgi:hypothetical protein
MFSGWQTFFQMTGDVAATLTGLLFVVATLTSGRSSSTMARGVKLFTTPTVFHFASIIIISALPLAPDSEGSLPSYIIIGWAGFGLGYSGYLAFSINAIDDPTHWSDFWCYGIAPTVAYLALTAATLAAVMQLRHAVFLVSLALLILLLVAIRNAWDLVTWLAPRRNNSNDGA